MFVQEEKKEDVYRRLEEYVKKGDQENIKVLLETYGVLYFQSFSMHEMKLLYCFLTFNIGLIEWAVKAGYDVNEVSDVGDNLLFYANKLRKNENLVDFLIEQGVNVNHVGEGGYTPILTALEAQNFELAKKLYQNGADVNVRNNIGEDMLYFIIAGANDIAITKEWIELLLSEPGRCDERLFKKLKALRLKALLV